VPIQWTVLVVPLIFLVQIMLMAALVLLMSALTVRLRDIRFVVPLALQLLMYSTPIIYPESAVPERWRWVFELNPLAVIIGGYRDAIIFGRLPSLSSLALAGGISAILLIVGYAYFKKAEAQFADII
jgi:lipopolysaccharide transport system permease protein